MTGLAGQHPGAPDATRYVLIPGAEASRQADIIELILADHRRIGRLCHALYDTARYNEGPRPDWMLGHVWQRLADLLVVHTQAEEETCYLPLLGTGGQATERMRDLIADHEDIRGTIGAAVVQPVGSAAWWHTVRTVMAVSAEHLEHEERDVVPVWLAGLSMSRRKELGRRWCAFVAAWRPDARFAQPPQRSSSGPRA
jgi:Hemerythrin HHE cation binding domain